MTDLDVNAPDVRARVERAFALHEAALVSNDVDTLDSLFWNNDRILRYGVAENLYGIGAIRAFPPGDHFSVWRGLSLKQDPLRCVGVVSPPV